MQPRDTGAQAGGGASKDEMVNGNVYLLLSDKQLNKKSNHRRYRGMGLASQVQCQCVTPLQDMPHLAFSSSPPSCHITCTFRDLNEANDKSVHVTASWSGTI